MLALEPRWGGSTKAMRAFFRESKKAGLKGHELSELQAMIYDEEGNEARTAGDVTGAEADYRKSLALGPCPCGDVRNDLNNLLFETRQYAAAITLLDQYLNQKPSDMWALANRGAAKLGMNKPEEAKVDWSTAAKAGDSFSQSQLGTLYFRGGDGVMPDYEQSVYWLRKAAAQGDEQAQDLLPHAESLAAAVRRDEKR